MDKHSLMIWRDSMLQAGVPFRRVRRHIRELKDHYEELRRDGLAQGLDPQAADAWADQQLGSLQDITGRMISCCTRRSVWQRLPRFLPLALPVLLYMLSLVCIVAVMVLVLETTDMGQKISLVGIAGYPWLDPAVQTLRAFLLHGLTPLLGLLLIRPQVCQQVNTGYWVTGIFLLCLLGSSTAINVSWPDPVAQIQGSIGASVGYGWQTGNMMRLLCNLAIAYVTGWVWWRRHRTLLLD